MALYVFRSAPITSLRNDPQRLGDTPKFRNTQSFNDFTQCLCPEQAAMQCGTGAKHKDF